MITPKNLHKVTNFLSLTTIANEINEYGKPYKELITPQDLRQQIQNKPRNFNYDFYIEISPK